MQTYSVLENQFVPYIFPELEKTISSEIELPTWDTRYEILNDFRSECTTWLQSGNKTKIRGLDRFKYAYIIHGASQYISDMCKFEKRTLELQTNEYTAYHKMIELYNMSSKTYSSFNDMGNDPNKLTILSYPRSLNGASCKDVERLLTRSKSKITLDSVFLGTNLFNIDFDFNKLNNVETFLYSFSKGFGLSYHRIGIMYTDLYIPEYDLYHVHAYKNLYGCQVARKVMKTFGIDYFTDKYQHVQQRACELLNVGVSDCLYLGLDRETTDPDKKVRITHLFDRLC